MTSGVLTANSATHPYALDPPSPQPLPSTQRGMSRRPTARGRHLARTAPGELHAHGPSASRAAMGVYPAGAEHVPTPIADGHALDMRATHEELGAGRTGCEALRRHRAEHRQHEQQRDPTQCAASEHHRER